MWTLVFGVGACRSFTTYCEEKMDCEGGNDAEDVEACEVNITAQADQADLYGCGGLFDDYFDCLESEASCENDVYGIDPSKDCEEEARDYQGCISR